MAMGFEVPLGGTVYFRESCKNIKHLKLKSFSPFSAMVIQITLGSLCEVKPTFLWAEKSCLWQSDNSQSVINGKLIRLWLRNLVPKFDTTTSGCSSLYSALLLLLHSSFSSSTLLLTIAWCCVFVAHCTCIPSNWIKKRELKKGWEGNLSVWSFPFIYLVCVCFALKIPMLSSTWQQF